MINHLFLYKGRGSLLILSFTSSTDKWNAALVILAIALSFRSWFPLFRILPQTASWYDDLFCSPAAMGTAFVEKRNQASSAGHRCHHAWESMDDSGHQCGGQGLRHTRSVE